MKKNAKNATGEKKERNKHEVNAENDRHKGCGGSHPEDGADEGQNAADNAEDAEDKVETVHCEAAMFWRKSNQSASHHEIARSKSKNNKNNK